MPLRHDVGRLLSLLARAAPGLALVLISVAHPVFRRADGWWSAPACAAASAGIALALIGVSARTRWQRSAGWFSVALVGQAVALQLIHSPASDNYQHYQPWHTLWTMPWIACLGVLCLQTVLVTWGLRHVRASVWQTVARLGTRTQWVMMCGALGFSFALGSENVPQYLVELALTIWIAGVELLTLLLMVLALPVSQLERLVGPGGGHTDEAPGWSVGRLVPWVGAAWVVLISGIISSGSFDRVPVIQDSVGYLFQAKYFAAGYLYLPPPPDAEAFAVSHLINDGGKWYAYGFPGWPALLALGVMAGAPWLVNPVIGGVCVVLAHALVRRLYDRRTAHAVVGLLVLSPWFLVMSANHMTHAATLLWILAGWLSLERARVEHTVRWGLVAGCCFGALFLTRPIDGILIGGVLGLSALGLGARRVRVKPLAALVVGAIVVGGVVFPYNYALTGDALYTPHSKWTDGRFYPGADRIGFGPDIGNVGWDHYDPFPGHGAIDVIVNLNKNLYQTNFELFGWPFGSLMFVFLLLVWREVRGSDRLSLAVLLATVGGLSVFWSAGGPDFGARYWYPMLVPLVILTVRGVSSVQRRLVQQWGPGTAPRVAAFVVAATLVAAVNVVPWRAVVKYHKYRGMSSDIARLAATHEFGQGLVFVRVDYPEEMHVLDATEDFASAFILNPPTLDPAWDGPIYAFDAGEEHRRRVQQAFPGRPVWVVGRAADGRGDHGYGELQVLEAPQSSGPQPVAQS